jgi:hypothetical protein
MEIQILTLLSPLYCTSTEGDPFSYREEDGEKLYCFLVNENEYCSFEPNRETLLGRPVFSQVLPEGTIYLPNNGRS